MDYSGKIIRKNPVTPSQTSASGVWSLDEALQAQKANTWPVANVPNPISRSLRFRNAAGAYLNRTPATAGNRRTWTWSAWVKRGFTGDSQFLFSCWTANNDAGEFDIYINPTGNLIVQQWTSSFRVTNAIYRDPSAWYHIVVAIDTTQATAGNRVKVYVNGSEVTSFSTTNNPTLNQELAVNQVGAHYISSYKGSIYYLEGYMAETYFIDGQALTPSSFGGTNAVTGVWEPRQYTGTYGTNGFLLTFSDNTSTTTLGYDTSGNSNNWTTNNISLTAGSTYDSMLDVPTQWIGYNTGDVASVTRGNYAVLNAINSPNGTLTNGNLTTTGNYQSTIGISSGKFYNEVTFSSATGYTGLGFTDGPYNNYVRYAPAYGSIGPAGNVTVSIGSQATYTSGTFMLAIDFAAGKYWMGMNGAWFASGNPATGANQTGTFGTSSTGSWFPECNEFAGGTSNFNFGQRPFAYTPPAGFLSLCTTNLSSPTILQGDDYMNAVLYTGNGASSRAITGVGFQPDLVWTKSRSGANPNVWIDSNRGLSKFLISNSTNAEGTDATLITSFDADGFTIGTDTPDYNNYNGDTYVAWNWKASNAAGVTNTAGSITSTVSANTTAGFSIVTYTGNGSSGATIGHGLGVAPRMVIVQTRTGTNNKDKPVYHASIGNTGAVILNKTIATDTWSGYWNNTSPASTVFTVGSDQNTNQSGSTYVAYCFAAVAGYSAFGSYTGNGSSDGPFVYLGFRPKFLIIKRTDSTGFWYTTDSVRDTYNPESLWLLPNATNAETSFVQEDFLSNGFKLRNTNVDWNASGGTYIYMAFAENPFKNALAR